MSVTHRKLTTIFSADVQGYSRLMEADEEGTLATLKQYREAMERLIEAHGGRVVNTWGDGLIAEFPSVVESVRVAIDVQNELAGRNAGRPDATRMQFRIGINLGDVIVDGDDIYGDGVNIAARLQSSAAPGGIVISNTVYDQVRNKMSVGFEFLGSLSVKNIEETVPSYAVRVGGQSDEAKPVERPAEPRFGRSPGPAAQVAETSGREHLGRVAGAPLPRSLAGLAVIGAGLVGINILTWSGTFWAQWPMLAFAALAGLAWARTTRRVDRGLAFFAVIAFVLVAINLLSWSGVFWAVWPIFGLAVAAGIRWAVRSRPVR
jgi:adenylate cyclase